MGNSKYIYSLSHFVVTNIYSRIHFVWYNSQGSLLSIFQKHCISRQIDPYKCKKKVNKSKYKLNWTTETIAYSYFFTKFNNFNYPCNFRSRHRNPLLCLHCNYQNSFTLHSTTWKLRSHALNLGTQRFGLRSVPP